MNKTNESKLGRMNPQIQTVTILWNGFHSHFNLFSGADSLLQGYINLIGQGLYRSSLARLKSFDREISDD